jgi:hypothetical protein
MFSTHSGTSSMWRQPEPPPQSDGRSYGEAASYSRASQHNAVPSPQSFLNKDDVFHFFSGVVNNLQRLLDMSTSRADHLERLLSDTNRRLHDIEARLQQPPPQQQGGWRPRRFYPRPTHNDDTPTVNKFLDRTAELFDAERRGVSLAPPNAKVKFVEHQGDLLLAPQVTKVQAVAADLRTSAGIAAQIKAAVGAPPPGVPGQPSIGDIIEQDAGEKGKFLHAVTKRVSHHKFQKKPVPFLEGTEKGLRSMAKFVAEQKLEEIAMPRMCSGLDGLNWLWVRDVLQDAWKDTDLTVHVYNLRPPRGYGQTVNPSSAPRPQHLRPYDGDDGPNRKRHASGNEPFQTGHPSNT